MRSQGIARIKVAWGKRKGVLRIRGRHLTSRPIDRVIFFESDSYSYSEDKYHSNQCSRAASPDLHSIPCSRGLSPGLGSIPCSRAASPDLSDTELVSDYDEEPSSWDEEEY